MIEIVKRFCGSKNRYLDLQDPFTIGEFTYATDGAIMIRVPRCDGTVVAGQLHPKGAEAIIRDAHKGVGFSARQFSIQAPVVQTSDCDCHHHECPTCECENFCEDCEDGIVTTEKRAEVLIDGVSFNPWYIELIQDLPGAEYSTEVHREKALPFKFEQGVGVVMPRRRGGAMCSKPQKERVG